MVKVDCEFAVEEAEKGTGIGLFKKIKFLVSMGYIIFILHATIFNRKK